MTGKVTVPEEKVLATKLAWETIGVKEVVNELQVTNLSSQKDIAKDLAAHAQLRGKLIADSQVSSLNYSIDVVNGIVYLSGISNDRQEMDRIVQHARELRFARQVVNYIQLRGDREQAYAKGVTQSASSSPTGKTGNTSRLPACPSNQDAYKHNCFGTYDLGNGNKYVGEWTDGKMNGQGTMTHVDGHKYVGEWTDGKINGQGTFTHANGDKYVGEWTDGKRNGQGTYTLADGRTAQEGVWKDNKFQYAKKLTTVDTTSELATSKNNQAKTSTSAALNAAQQQAEAERQKRLELEQELAALKAKQEDQQQNMGADKQVPLITITKAGTNQRKGIIRGFAEDNVQLAEVLIDGTAVSLGSDGSFEWSGFVPATGKDIIIEAIDTAALSSRKVVRLERGQIQQASGPKFDDLDPTSGKRVKRNNNALALIVGISDYERTDAPAIYADKDAQYFHDYASLKLGIPDQNIMTLVNDKAEQGDVFLAVADWMRRSSKPGKSDIYIFFAGHGLASQDGEQMYLLPYDGRPRLLDKTAILRDELFSDIASAKPRSVTVFLDTCYSGTTRGPDMLIASRPIAIRAKEQAVPDGFTVMTAAAGDQTAKPLEEAKHGMFSYFLMKGMEGDADANQDNQITAGELHAYVQQNVIQQSSGSQTPELQGDADRVLVRFQ